MRCSLQNASDKAAGVLQREEPARLQPQQHPTMTKDEIAILAECLGEGLPDYEPDRDRARHAGECLQIAAARLQDYGQDGKGAVEDCIALIRAGLQTLVGDRPIAGDAKVDPEIAAQLPEISLEMSEIHALSVQFENLVDDGWQEKPWRLRAMIRLWPILDDHLNKVADLVRQKELSL